MLADGGSATTLVDGNAGPPPTPPDAAQQCRLLLKQMDARPLASDLAAGFERLGCNQLMMSADPGEATVLVADGRA